MELPEEARNAIKKASETMNESTDEDPFETEYWDYDCNMSREKLSDVLYATVICGGSIPSTHTLARNMEFDRRQNARNTACFRIELPAGERERWEEIVGGELEEPPTVAV